MPDDPYAEMMATLQDGTGHAQIKALARDLLEAPQSARGLLDACANLSGDGPDDTLLVGVLATVLDEARMASENGQARGHAFIEDLAARVEELIAADSITKRGGFAIASSWVQAGLTPPEALTTLAAQQAETSLALHPSADPDAMFEAGFGDLIHDSDGSVSALHAAFAELLPMMPADARESLVHTAVSRPEPACGGLGCAWLLDPSDPVRNGAVQGLADRLAAGHLTAEMIASLTALRNWLPDPALRPQVDQLIRDALRQGIAAPASQSPPKLHRILASMIDGSGAQSIAVATQSGSRRGVAVVLLKQGHGVKDAYVIPCSSATEQRELIATIAGEVEALDVPRDYLAQALGLALTDGIKAGHAPAPGLLEVTQALGLEDLRPAPAGITDILEMTGADECLAKLSVQARGRLITASEIWEIEHPMTDSWYEDSDAVTEALEKAKSRTAMNRAVWQALETRRSHWAYVIARTGLLLAAHEDRSADSFFAVAQALEAGRDLKKTPVMAMIHYLTLEVWFDRTGGSGAPFGVFPERAGTEFGPDDLRADAFEPTGMNEAWIDGYLTAICSAPVSMTPSDWLPHLFEGIGPDVADGAELQIVLDQIMQRYNDLLARLRTEADDADHFPERPVLIPDWAEGFLAAWDANRRHWPGNRLGKTGKGVRAMLEEARDGGEIDLRGL